MMIILESTTKLVELTIGGASVPARVWQGTAEDGTPVHAFITRIVPETHEAARLKAFDRELRECKRPSAVVEAIPLRLVL